MIGLVTADVAAPLDPDLLPFAAAMRSRLGDAAVSIVAWDDPSIDWASFRAVIIRSPWNYTERLDEFLAWIDRVDAIAIELHDVWKPGCGDAFFKAIAPYRWCYSVHGEMILCERWDGLSGHE